MTITIDLPPETEARLREEAANDGLSVEDYVLNLIEAHIYSPEELAALPALPRRKLSKL